LPALSPPPLARLADSLAAAPAETPALAALPTRLDGTALPAVAELAAVMPSLMPLGQLAPLTPLAPLAPLTPLMPATARLQPLAPMPARLASSALDNSALASPAPQAKVPELQALPYLPATRVPDARLQTPQRLAAPVLRAEPLPTLPATTALTDSPAPLLPDSLPALANVAGPAVAAPARGADGPTPRPIEALAAGDAIAASAAASAALASAAPAPAPLAADRPGPARAAGPATGTPDAGNQLGVDIATPASVPASAPRLNLQLPRSRGGELSRLGSAGLLAVLPRPPELKTKLAQDIEQAGKPDCRTAHAGMGLLAVVPLAVDALKQDGGCRW